MRSAIVRSIQLLLILFFTSQLSMGQSLLDYDTYLTDLENSGQTQKAERIKAQFNGLFTCIYVNDSWNDQKGQNTPTAAFSTSQIINNLNNQSPDFARIETLVIRVKNPGEAVIIRADILDYFPVLKYIIYNSDNEEASNILRNLPQNSSATNLVKTAPKS